MKRGDLLTLTLEDAVFEGKSVARADGLVVFVTGAVPGDRVRAELTKIKKSFCEARAVEVVTPSVLRAVPRCRYFGTCGGCRWQNVQYDAQLAFKRRHVIDAFERIGGIRGVHVQETLRSEDEYFYRNKMEFSFGERWRTSEELALRDERQEHPPESAFALGLHVPQRYDRVLDIEECWLQSETSVQIVNAVRRLALLRGLTAYSARTQEGFLRNLVIRQSAHTGEIMVNVVTRVENREAVQALTEELLRLFPAITTVCNNITDRLAQVAVGDREVIYHGPGFITERLGSRIYRISANSFFQTNTRQAERLYETARRMARLKPTDLVYDLYSGTGTIGLHIADDVRAVVGIEQVAPAVEDARRNATMNGVQNCRFVQGDLRNVLTRQRDTLMSHGAPDVMILDPPRAGMHPDVVRVILDMMPQRIVYISCNPTTQARDTALLVSRYRIEEVQPVDMFPHTFHIENIVAFSR
jgi:23S rRNA (uracil1939-C5)-methyltransferase